MRGRIGGDCLLTSKEVQNRFGVSNFTARMDLKALVSLGFMEEIKVNLKKINYIKSENFDQRIKQINK